MVDPSQLLLPAVGALGAGAGLLLVRRYMPLMVEAVTNGHKDEEAFWRGLLTGDDPGVPMYWMREAFGVVRSPERCKVCNIPFSGTGSLLFQALWSGPSNLTPHFCKKCEDFARRHHGGAEVEMTMLFVDVRGSTRLAEGMSAGEFRALLNRFYAVATDVLTDHGAWLDKFVGDEAIGLFIPGFAGKDHAYLAVKAAHELLRATGHGSAEGPWVPLGVGINTGPAFMGTVGTGKVCDITALGDEVNVAARLSAEADAGQIVFSANTRAAIGAEHAGFLEGLALRHEQVALKGKSGPVEVYRHGAADDPAVDGGAVRPLQPGLVVDRYVVRRLLGIGGTAQVWEVRHRALGTAHALKVLTWADPALQRRLLREARAQAQLDHRHIVPVRDVVDVNGSPGLLLPLIEGPALDEVLDGYRPAFDEAVALMRGITEGVAHAHACGFAHRDLKPGNVLLDLGDGHVTPRVADFGLVKGAREHTHTRPGVVMGTLGYAAPEQLMDARSADARADLWSLGVMLHELCTGEKPFRSASVSELLEAQRAGADLSRVPAPLRELVGELLVVDPARRMADCAALLGALPPGDALPDDGPLGRHARGLADARLSRGPSLASVASTGDDTLAPLESGTGE